MLGTASKFCSASTPSAFDGLAGYCFPARATRPGLGTKVASDAYQIHFAVTGHYNLALRRHRNPRPAVSRQCYLIMTDRSVVPRVGLGGQSWRGTTRT